MTFKQDGDYFGGDSQPDICRRELSRHNLQDAAVRFDADILRSYKLNRGFLLRTPPYPGSLRPRDIFKFADLLKKYCELSESQLYEFIRFFTRWSSSPTFYS